MAINRLIPVRPHRRHVVHGLSVCLFGMLSLTSAIAGQPSPGAGPEGSAQLREDADTLLSGNRSVLAKVLAISSEQIKVDVGEVQPRFLPLKQANQKASRPSQRAMIWSWCSMNKIFWWTIIRWMANYRHTR